MSEDKTYKDGDIVWVKLGNNWWPGEVIGSEERLPEGLNQLKRKPYCVVKFFQENAFEYPKSAKQVYPFQCPKKDEFVKKGLALFNAKKAFMEKFPDDVKYAESLTKPSTTKISIPFINDRSDSIVKAVISHGQVRRSTDYYETRQAGVSGSGQNSREQSILRNDPMTTPNRTSIGSATSLLTPATVTRTMSTSSSASVTPNSAGASANCQYRCNMCDFITMRQNVLIMHRKSHSSSSSTSTVAGAASQPVRSSLSLVKPKTNTATMIKSPTKDALESVNVISTKLTETLTVTKNNKSAEVEELKKEEHKVVENSSTPKRNRKKLSASPSNATKRTTRAACSTPQQKPEEEISNVPHTEDIADDNKEIPAVVGAKHTEKIRERLLADWSDEEKDDLVHTVVVSSNSKAATIVKNELNSNLQLPTTSSKSYTARLIPPTIVPATALQGDGLMVGSVTQLPESSNKPTQRIRNIPKKDRLREFEQSLANQLAAEAKTAKTSTTEIKNEIIETEAITTSPKKTTETQKTRSRSRAEVNENENNATASTLSCFDFKEDDEENENNVLKSIAKYKKKYFSPEKAHKEQELHEQKAISMQRDLELSAEIDNLLETTTIVAELKVDTVPVKGLPIKERGKRFFKSRNRSRLEDDEVVLTTQAQQEIQPSPDTSYEETTLTKSERKLRRQSKRAEERRSNTPQKATTSPINGKAIENEKVKSQETTHTPQRRTRKTHNNRIMQQLIEEDEASIPFIRHSPVELYSCDVAADAAATLIRERERERRSKTATPSSLTALRDEVANGASGNSNGGNGSRASSRNFNAPPLTPTDETSSFGISEAGAEFGSPASSLDEERLLTPRETPSLSEYDNDNEINSNATPIMDIEEPNDDEDEIESPQHEALSGNEHEDVGLELHTRTRRIRTPKKNMDQEISEIKATESTASKKLRHKALDITEPERGSPKRLTRQNRSELSSKETETKKINNKNDAENEEIKNVKATTPSRELETETDSLKKLTHRKTRVTRSQTPIRDRLVDTPTSNFSVESADATSKDRKRNKKSERKPENSKTSTETSVEGTHDNNGQLTKESIDIKKEDTIQEKFAEVLLKTENTDVDPANETLTSHLAETNTKKNKKSSKPTDITENEIGNVPAAINVTLDAASTKKLNSENAEHLKTLSQKEQKEVNTGKAKTEKYSSETKKASAEKLESSNKTEVSLKQNRNQTKTPTVDKDLLEQRKCVSKKSADTDLADTKSADKNLACTKTADINSASAKPVDKKSASSILADKNSAIGKTAEINSTDCKSDDSNLASIKPVDINAVNSKPADTISAISKSADKNSGNSKSADKNSANSKPAVKNSACNKAADINSANVKSTDIFSASNKPADTILAKSQSPETNSTSRKRHAESSEKSTNHKAKTIEVNESVGSDESTQNEKTNKESKETLKERETHEKLRAPSPKKHKSSSSEKSTTKKNSTTNSPIASPTIEKVRINVDVANPLSTQIASILAASGSTSNVSQQAKSNTSKHKTISPLKRKLSSQTDGDSANDAVVAHVQSLCPQVKITRKERPIEPIVDATIPEKLLATPKKSISPNTKGTPPPTSSDITQMPIVLSSEITASPPSLVSSNLWQTELLQPPNEQPPSTPPNKKINFDARGHNKYVVLNPTEQTPTQNSPRSNSANSSPGNGNLSSSPSSQKSPAGVTGGRKQAGNTLVMPSSNNTIKQQQQQHKFAEALALADSVLGPTTKPTKRRSSQTVSNSSNTAISVGPNANRRFSSATATDAKAISTPPAKLRKQMLSEERSKASSPSKMQSNSGGSSSNSSPISKTWSQTQQQTKKLKKSDTPSEEVSKIVTETVTKTVTATTTSPALTSSTATLTATAAAPVEETQTIVESEQLNSAAKITAVPIQPIPGYSDTFMLCMLVDNIYKPINNIPHYLNTDLNQLVPVPPHAYEGMLPELDIEQPHTADNDTVSATSVNASLTTTTSPSSKSTSIVSTREGSGENLLIPEGTEADDSELRIGLQLDETSLIASGGADVDTSAIAVETDANETATDSAIVLNLENQQIILDAATFEQLLANPDANAQLITDDGTEFSLTHELLAALKAQHDDQNAELLAIPADQQQQQLQDQLIASETAGSSTADLLSVALANSEFYGGEMLQIETTLGVAGSAVDAAGLQLLASDGSIVFQAPPLSQAHLTPPITAHTSETNAVLNQTPIMSTLEKPSTASKTGIDSPTAAATAAAVVDGNLSGSRPNLDDSLAVIGVSTQSSTVPSSLELPITITNPAIAPKVTMTGTTLAPTTDLVQFSPRTSATTATVVGIGNVFDDSIDKID